MSGCKGSVTKFIKTIDTAAGNKLLKGTANGAGRRLYPSHTTKKDEVNECRIDQGHVFDDDATTYQIVLQANSQAKSPGLQNLVRKYSSHAILATFTIDKSENDGKGPSVPKIREGLLADFERREEEEDFS